MPVLDEVEDITGCKRRLVLASVEKITKSSSTPTAAARDFRRRSPRTRPPTCSWWKRPRPTSSVIDEMAGASPVINLVNGLIQRAVRDGASDVHIEPLRTRSLVRFRIDGVLYEALTLRPTCIPRWSRA